MQHDIDCDFNCSICNGDGEGSQSHTGWLNAIRGPKRGQLLEEKFQLLRSKNENKGEPLPLEWNYHTSSDEAIEKDMVIQTALGTVNKQIHNNHKNPRDVRRFKKNQVKTVEDREVCRISDMEKVLPKESEGEIQLRLEDDEDERKEEFAEVMFSERFDVGLKKKKSVSK